MAKKHHHLEQRGKVWYFVGMVKRRRYLVALSEDELTALNLRDDYLKEIRNYGEIISLKPIEPEQHEEQPQEVLLFGKVAVEWASQIEGRIEKRKRLGKGKQELKYSTWRDYKSIMNCHVLPRFGNLPIRSISLADIEDFTDSLDCSSRRINNILVPVRSIFDIALKKGIIDNNIMTNIKYLKEEKADPNPLSHDEVLRFLEHVDPHFVQFFTVAFYTGLRFGEMGALKWKNVWFDKSLICVRETRVYGEEGRPKTKKSYRDIDMLPPVRDALEYLYKKRGDDKYVFRDKKGRLLVPDHLRNVIWTPALKKADLEYRPMIQTRHSFATMMIDAGENIGWIQNMMGHATLQMIFDNYHSWIKRPSKNDGTAFMSNFYRKTEDAGIVGEVGKE